MSVAEEIKTDSRKAIKLILDEEIIYGIERLRDVLGLPVEQMISEAMRPFVNAFLPLAELKANGQQLTVEQLSDLQSTLESMILRTDAAKARLDRNIKGITKKKKEQDKQCGEK